MRNGPKEIHAAEHKLWGKTRTAGNFNTERLRLTVWIKKDALEMINLKERIDLFVFMSVH